MYRTCVFCNQQVLSSEYSAHEALHYRQPSAAPRAEKLAPTIIQAQAVEPASAAPWEPNAAQQGAGSNLAPFLAVGGIALAVALFCSGMFGAGLLMTSRRKVSPVVRPSTAHVRPALPPAADWPARSEPMRFEPPPIVDWPIADPPIVPPAMPPLVGPTTVGPPAPPSGVAPSTIGPAGAMSGPNFAAERFRQHQQRMEEHRQRVREMQERFRRPNGPGPQRIDQLPRGPVVP